MSAEESVSRMLVDLTEAIEKSGDEIAIQGILGGTYGYGAWFKNDVFEMRPFWWGNCECGREELEAKWENENGKHADTCYQIIRHNNCFVDSESYDRKEGHGWDECDCDEKLCAEMGLTYPAGSAVHCTCGTTAAWFKWEQENPHDPNCGYVAPNFKHLATGYEVRWYKYIGRSMEIEDGVSKSEWRRIFADCFASLEDK